MRQWRISCGARRKNAPIGALMSRADAGRAVFPVVGGWSDVKPNMPFPGSLMPLPFSRMTGGQ